MKRLLTLSREIRISHFFYLSHYAVHTMLHGKKALVEKYRNKPGAGKSNPSDNNPEDDFYKKWPRDYFSKQNNPHLAAQLETIDEGVGMIREQLEKLGLSEDTLIIFTSDNGGELRVTDNAPLRGVKSELYEGGIREPFLAFIPGVTPSNKVIDTPQQRIMISIQPYVNLQVLIKKITRMLMV